VLGLNTFAVRLVTAAFGVATVGLMLYLRRYIGAVGALAAAALVAFSPGAVYYSRYFIHETLFVFFTVALVVAALRYWETGEALYMLLAAASAALMFATKETAFISAGVLLLAAGVAWGWTYATRRPQWDPPPKPFQPYKPAARNDAPGRLERFGGASRVGLLLAAAAAVFVFINVVFYSSFFTNAKGVGDALETFKVWTKTGTSDFHKKDFQTYVWWLGKEESPVLVLATIGAAASLFARRRNRFAVFAGAWAFGTALAYSLIPYKTPWLMLSFTVPMAIAGGYAVQLVADWSRRSAVARALAALCVGFALAVCIYQTAVLNFFEYDDDRHPYVYAHTRRGRGDDARGRAPLAERGRGQDRRHRHRHARLLAAAVVLARAHERRRLRPEGAGALRPEGDADRDRQGQPGRATARRARGGLPAGRRRVRLAPRRQPRPLRARRPRRALKKAGAGRARRR
jgi:uncharacterized protein (TIGR03663 family)